jgi:hypothetical protein
MHACASGGHALWQSPSDVVQWLRPAQSSSLKQTVASGTHDPLHTVGQVKPSGHELSHSPSVVLQCVPAPQSSLLRQTI